MTAVLLFLGIVASGIMTILGIIFTAISFAYSKKARFIWLTVFFVSSAALFALIYKATVETTKFTEKLETNFKNSVFREIGSEYKADYHLADSINSIQVQLLKMYEPSPKKGKVPEQFYHYLGFGSYYRLPLAYPYSVHCEDTLDKGSLFSEEDVELFNENDNGEKDCGITNIIGFDFDRNIFLAEVLLEPGKEKSWLICNFRSRKTEWFESKQKMEAAAVKQGFGRKPVLISCHDYFGRLDSQKND